MSADDKWQIMCPDFSTELEKINAAFDAAMLKATGLDILRGYLVYPFGVPEPEKPQKT